MEVVSGASVLSSLPFKVLILMVGYATDCIVWSLLSGSYLLCLYLSPSLTVSCIWVSAWMIVGMCLDLIRGVGLIMIDAHIINVAHADVKMVDLFSFLPFYSFSPLFFCCYAANGLHLIASGYIWNKLSSLHDAWNHLLFNAVFLIERY